MSNNRKNNNPLVSIVIINYNTAKITQQSLESIRQNTEYSPYEIIIIDNASKDEDQKELKKFADDQSIPLHIMEENIGWNRGVNFGFSIAKGELLVTINSDVLVEKRWLANMVDIYLSEELVGAVNANIFEDGKSIISSTNNQLKILHSACTMYSSQAWDLVGEMDHKNFHFYGTENDWSYRARSIGFKLLFSKESRVNHLGSSMITSGGGLSVMQTGKILDILKVRLDGRIKFRFYNYRINDWISKQILFEFKDAYKNGYLTALIYSYLRVMINIKSIYVARKDRRTKMKSSKQIIESSNLS